jgi:hypothetical protein
VTQRFVAHTLWENSTETRNHFGNAHDVAPRRNRTIEPIRIGSYYDTTSGTLWKDGTYYPQGTRVLVTGLHLDQGYCVRFPAEDGREVDDETEPLETWEDWEELDFLAPEGTVERGGTLPTSVLSEAQEVLDDAEDGCHLHLHESEDD